MPVAADVAQLPGLRYVALTLGGAITGFAAVQITSAVGALAETSQPVLAVTGVKLASIVAPENASAVPALASNPAALLPPAPGRELLLAPVLAR